MKIKILRYLVVFVTIIFFVSCANYLKRRYFKGYYHVKASSQSDFVLNKKNKYNLIEDSNKDKPLYGSSEGLITSIEIRANKNIFTKISSEKKNFNVGKQNVNKAHIKSIKKTVTIFNKKNENKNYKEKPEKDIEYYNKKFKNLLVLSIVLIILNVILYTLSYFLNPHPMGCGYIPIFFYGIFFFVALFYFIKAIIYIVKFWGKEKPKYFYWFVVLSIFNLFLFFILFNGIFTIFPFLGYLGFL